MFCSTPAWGLESIIIEEHPTEISLDENLWYLEDTNKQWHLADLQGDHTALPWQRYNGDTPAFGYTESAFWFRFRLQNLTFDSQRLLLEIAYPLLDDVRLFAVQQDGTIITLTSGDRQPFSQRLIPHRNFLFPLLLASNASVDVYLYVESTSSLQLPISLWHEQAYWLNDAKTLQ